MRRLHAFCSLLLLPACLLAAAAPRELRLAVGETATLHDGAARSAFAVDGAIVEVAVTAGDLALTGRRSGQTLVTIVRAAGVDSLLVRVEAPGRPRRWGRGKDATTRPTAASLPRSR
jgi:hypothetical protein